MRQVQLYYSIILENDKGKGITSKKGRGFSSLKAAVAHYEQEKENK